MKQTITISALAVLLSLPAHAQIANNATCNNTNLGQSANNSTANVEANWNANTININWYNGDTKITSNTCTYDGAITLPTQPTKPGYTFAGWRLRAAPVGPNCSAISDSTTCYDTDGCVYNDACRTAIPVESAPYTKCSEITDENTCLSIKASGEYNAMPMEVCHWYNNSCLMDMSYGTLLMIPQSWCEYAGDNGWRSDNGYRYRNGYCDRD